MEGGEVLAHLRSEPLSSAPALYTFTIPGYFATNLRAREYGKQINVQLTGCYARDVPMQAGQKYIARGMLGMYACRLSGIQVLLHSFLLS